MATKYCNDCTHCKLDEVCSNANYTRYNLQCEYSNVPHFIKSTYGDKELVLVPSWCPKEKTNTTVSHSKRSIFDIFKDAKPLIEWDDIKVNGIYHIPPIWSKNDRKDIIVISKTPDHISYKILSKDPSQNNNITQVFYRTAIHTKFMHEHRLMKIQAMSKATN